MFIILRNFKLLYNNDLKVKNYSLIINKLKLNKNKNKKL